MKRSLLILLLAFAFKTANSQTMDLTMYITPDYGSCSGKIVFKQCGMMTYNIVFDGVTAVSPSAPMFSAICSGSHVLYFTASDVMGNVYYFAATIDLNPGTPSVAITGSAPSPPLTVITHLLPPVSGCTGMIIAEASNGVPPYTFSWEDGTGTTLAGETNDTLSGLCSGDYGVIVTDSYGVPGCTAIADAAVATLVPGIPSAIGEVQENLLQAYPNPVNSLLHIQANNIKSIDVYNSNGQVVKSVQVNAMAAIDFGEMPKGVYHLKAVTNDGELLSRRILKL